MRPPPSSDALGRGVDAAPALLAPVAVQPPGPCVAPGGTPRRRRPGDAAGAVLGLALAVAATLFFGGDLGRWNDDYFFLRQFHRGAPVTAAAEGTGGAHTAGSAAGETVASAEGSAAGAGPGPMTVRSYVLDGPMHFWRPLYRWCWTPLVVALYDRPRVLHVIAAAVHVAVAFGVWGLARRLGASRTAAAIAGMAFLVYPAGFEGPFWIPCTPTPIGTGMMLAALWAYGRWAADACSPEPARGLGAALRGLAPAWLTLAACALNEQPAFIAAALPAVLVCVGAGGWAVRRPVLALWPAALAVGVVGAYMLVAAKMNPQPGGAARGAYVPPGELVGRAAALFQEVASRHALRGVEKGAWRAGVAAVASWPALAAVLGAAVLGAGAVWALGPGERGGAASGRDGRPPAGAGPVRAGAAMVLLGAAVVLASWGPLVFIRYPASPRLAYAPSAGLAIALAGLLHLSLGRSWRRPARHRAARSAAVPLLTAGAVMMIGVQAAYRARWRADERQGAALRRLVGELPAGSAPLFVPVRVQDRPVRTGDAAFDKHFLSPLLSEWAAGWWLQLHLRREDALCTLGWGGPTPPPMLEWLDGGRVRTKLRVAPPGAGSGRTFDLARVVPFEVDERGEVFVYTHVQAAGGEGDAGGTTPLPLVAGAVRAGRAPERVLVAPRSAAAH